MDFTIVIVNLIVLLVLAKIMGELCERIGFPSVLGYIITGIIAGPMLFGALMVGTIQPTLGDAECAPMEHNPIINKCIYIPETSNLCTHGGEYDSKLGFCTYDYPSRKTLSLFNFNADNINIFAQLGIILMLFITGFQQGNINELLKNKKAIVITSLAGYILPFALAMVIGYFFIDQLGFNFNDLSALSFLLLMSLAVASTDSGITIKSIMSVGKLDSKPGRIMLGVTVMDGMMGLIIFTAIMTYVCLGAINLLEIAQVLAMIIVFILIFIVMQRIIPKFIHVVEHLSVEQAEFSFAFIFMILLAVIAERFGLHGIIGAFLAGIILSRCPLATTSFVRKLSSISYGIFIPLFFVWTGLLLNFGDLIEPAQIWLAFTIIGGVVIGNSIAAYFSGKVSGLNEQDSLLMSITMLPRGDINLVIASIAITMTRLEGDKLVLIVPKEIGTFIYSTVMLLILFAAIVTFVLLKIFIKIPKKGEHHGKNGKNTRIED